MSAADIVWLVLAVAVLGYLVGALLRADRLS